MVIMVAEAGFEPTTSRLSSLPSCQTALLCCIPAPRLQGGCEREVYADLGFTLHLHSAIIPQTIYELLCLVRKNFFNGF